MIYCNVIILKVILILLVLNTILLCKDTTKILIFKFQDISQIPNNYSNQQSIIPIEIKNKLNNSKELFVDVKFYDSLDSKYVASFEEISGRPSYESIGTIISNLKSDFDFLLMGTYQYDQMDVFTIDCYVVNVRSRVQEYQFRVNELVVDRSSDIRILKAPQDLFKELTTKVQKELELYFIGRIRIGIFQFNATDKNINPKFAYLEDTLPSMLISFLLRRGSFKLIETKLDKVISELSKSKDTLERFDIRKINERYYLNYIISGEYCQMKDKFRVDVRCISRAGEILYSDGFTLNEIDLSSLSSSLQELSTRMSSIIERDFSPQELKTKSIAVVAFPPSPLNKIVTLKSSYIRKTLVNKLRFIKDLRVKNNEEMIENYLLRSEEKFKICSDLDVGNLLVIQCDEFEDESMMIYYDLFSIDNPNLELMRNSKYVYADSIDDFLNELVFEIDQKLGYSISDTISDLKSKVVGIKTPQYLNRWTIGIKGSSVIRANESIYVNDGLGDYYEGFLTYHLDNRSNIVFQLGYDSGKRSKTSTGEEIRVTSILIGGFYKYEFMRLLKLGLYLGGGISFIQAYRGFENKQGITEENGKGATGFTGLAGVEIKLIDFGISVFLEPRYVWAFDIDRAITSTGFIFPGGRLGGFYLNVGIGYNFNL